MTGVFQYAVVRFVPDVVRDEGINVGVIVRDTKNQLFGYRFLPRGAAIRKLAPAADRRLVANFEHELAKLQNKGQLFPMGTLGLVGHPTDPEFFDRAREEYNGNLQLSSPRGLLADSIDAAVRQAFRTFVAEPEGTARPINYQSIAPYLMRERVWAAFERRELLRPGLVQREIVVEGKHAPWTFDLGFKDGQLHVISSIALNASNLDINLGRALVYKGMVDDVRLRYTSTLSGTAVVQESNKENGSPGAGEAKSLLEDANIEVVDIGNVGEFAESIRSSLAVMNR